MSLMTKLGLRSLLASCLIASAGVAHAQLNVLVTGVGSTQFPIATANFAGETSAPQSVSEIVRQDLQRSGKFSNIDAGSSPVSETASVDLGAWKAKGANAFVAGSVTRAANGQYDVKFRLYDTVKGQSLGGLSFTTPQESLRLTAHKISDYIYQKLLGERGVFATRLSYVIKVGNRYQLQISDSDGQDAHVALSSPEPIISPAWSPDGTKVAYVSFEKKKPIVYIQICPRAAASSCRIRRATTAHRRGRLTAAPSPWRSRARAIRRFSRSMRTAAACVVCRRARRSIRSRSTLLTASGFTSRAIAAASRRFTGCPRRASKPARRSA